MAADLLYADNSQDALAARVRGLGSNQAQQGRGRAIRYQAETAPTPSYMRPMTPYGDTYTQSYTKYLNAPGSSYVHPLFPLFNDRRPSPPKMPMNTPGYLGDLRG